MRRRRLTQTKASYYSKLKTTSRTKVTYTKVKVVMEAMAEAEAAAGGGGGDDGGGA